MHELSLAQSILDVVNEHLPCDGKTNVKFIKIRVGKLSNILTDSLKFCFDALKKDSRFAKTELIIRTIPLTIQCKTCGERSSINDLTFTCPVCSSINIQVVNGNDLSIEEIEIE